MAISSFKKIYTQDQDLQRIQQNTQVVFDGILNQTIIQGNLLPSVSLSNGVDTIIQHKLGYRFTGWIIVNKNATGDVWNSSTVNNKPHQQIILQSDADLIVDLWIF